MKYYIKIHNYFYNRISLLAIEMNNGIHPKHNITKYHYFFINNVDDNSLILDVGCADGYITEKLSKKARKVVGIDINCKLINLAIKKNRRKNVEYICSDIMNYNFKEKFDFIILSNVLEHIEKRIELLKKLKLYGSVLLIRVPLIDRSWLPLYKKKLGYEYRTADSHYIEYTYLSFKRELEKAGLSITSYSIQFGEIWAKIKL